MASSLSKLTAFARRNITASPLAPIYHTTRRLCHNDDESYEPLANLLSAVSPSVVALRTYFDDSSSFRAATGVFVTRRLLVTSAHAVGRVDGENGEIGCTFAITAAGKVLRTTLHAVYFGGDVAVLKAAEDPNTPPLSVEIEIAGRRERDTLTVISRHEECDDAETGVVQVTPTWLVKASTREARPQWVHRVDDAFGWARYGGLRIIEGAVKILPGSPWINAHRKLVGIASSAAGTEKADSSSGFVVPPARILAAVIYGFNEGNIMDFSRYIELVKTYDDYDAHLIHIKELGNTRRRFVSTSSSFDTRTTSDEVRVSIDGDGKKLTVI